MKDKRPKGAKPIPAPMRCPVCDTKVEREALPDEMAVYRCVNTACDRFYERRDVKKAKLPEQCPLCEQPVEVLDAGIKLLCPNPVCPAQIKEQLRWFCHRSQMDIEGIGEKLIEQLVDRKMVATFADLYRLKADDIAALESETTTSGKTVKRTVGEKTAAKVTANIARSRERPLDRLLAGLGIHHIGQGGSRALANGFGSLDAIAAASVEDLSAVEDIGAITAQSVHDFFHSRAGIDTVADLKSVGVDPQQAVVTTATAPTTDLPWAGKAIVVTGTLPTLDREAARGADRRARRQGQRQREQEDRVPRRRREGRQQAGQGDRAGRGGDRRGGVPQAGWAGAERRPGGPGSQGAEGTDTREAFRLCPSAPLPPSLSASSGVPRSPPLSFRPPPDWPGRGRNGPMLFGICTPSSNATALRAAGWDYVEDNVQGLLQGLVPDDQWAVPRAGGAARAGRQRAAAEQPEGDGSRRRPRPAEIVHRDRDPPGGIGRHPDAGVRQRGGPQGPARLQRRDRRPSRWRRSPAWRLSCAPRTASRWCSSR